MHHLIPSWQSVDLKHCGGVVACFIFSHGSASLYEWLLHFWQRAFLTFKNIVTGQNALWLVLILKVSCDVQQLLLLAIFGFRKVSISATVYMQGL